VYERMVTTIKQRINWILPIKDITCIRLKSLYKILLVVYKIFVITGLFRTVMRVEGSSYSSPSLWNTYFELYGGTTNCCVLKCPMLCLSNGLAQKKVHVNEGLGIMTIV